MVRKRNETVHIYNETVADEIYDLIINRYIEVIGDIVRALRA